MQKTKDEQSQNLIERMTNYMSSIPPKSRMEPDHVLKIASEEAQDLTEDEIAECYAAAISIAKIHSANVIRKTERMRQKMSAVQIADMESREDSGHRYADRFQRPDPSPDAPKKTCIMCGQKNTTGQEYRCVLCKSGYDATIARLGAGRNSTMRSMRRALGSTGMELRRHSIPRGFGIGSWRNTKRNTRMSIHGP